MTKDVVVVGTDEDFKSCAKLLRIHDISALPVVDEAGKLIVVVSESDLLAKERERGTKRRLGGRWVGDPLASASTAGEVMTSPAISIGPKATVPEAARLMYREAVKRLPVVDAEGVVIGIVSRADLLKTFTRSDESIHHDITDNIIKKALFIDPRAVHVVVTNGHVRLVGELETKSLCGLLIQMVGRVEGTVGLTSELTYRLDDTHLGIEPPPRSLQLAADDRY
ncbi:MAG TPA: CBS domain-containing protein [Patescibacteria group bacterium]|nr:CBS domain-containing protein [Patescibacteria group bacterium]